jgi:hypothetical protein
LKKSGADRRTVTQPSLFDDGAERGAIVTTVGVIGSARTLSKEQRQFNTLIAKIEAKRKTLAQWRDFVPVYRQRCAAEIEPISARTRELRAKMVTLLDRTMSTEALSKTQRRKVTDILLGQLALLLEEQPDAELIRLHDKYSPVSFADSQQDEMDFIQSLASAAFGVELDPRSEANTPEELARLIGERVQAAESASESESAPEPRAAGKKRAGSKQQAKAVAQEALRAEAAQGASKAVREVYRKLASELHPDREPNQEQRARKTTLMQELNQAYDAGDLLALLELQLRIEQIDSTAFAGLAPERLAHYNLVLKEQLLRLQDELIELSAPFAVNMGIRAARQLTPEDVLRAMDADLREARGQIRALQADLLRWQDIERLKSDLKHYRIERPDADDVDALLASLPIDPFVARRR